jgi:hypothetical protein
MKQYSHDPTFGSKYTVRIPGKRTIRALAVAAVPTRVYFVMAGIGVFTALMMQAAAMVSARYAAEWISAEMATYAAMFRALPIWFLVSGSLHQVATRLNQAIDDWKTA